MVRKIYLRSWRSIKRSWLPMLTALIVLLAVIAVVFSKDLQQAAELSIHVSGFAAALAFLWLVVGFRSQAKELRMQREELKLQRIALELQAKEQRDALKFSSLSQISQILNSTNDRITSSGLNVSAASDLIILFTAGMANWKTIFESRYADVVFAHCNEWLKIERLARSYIAAVAMALKIYLEHYSEVEYDTTKSDEEFVFIYHKWMSKAPYLSEHAGSAYMLASTLSKFQPGLKAIQVSWMAATKKVAGENILKNGALERLKQDLTEKNIPIPAIARDVRPPEKAARPPERDAPPPEKIRHG